MYVMAMEILIQKRNFIVENIYDIASILDYLLSADVISFDQRDEIMTKETRSKRTDELVNVLITCHPAALEEFCKALALTGYEFVADELKTALHDLDMKAPVSEQESDWLYCSLDQHLRCQLVTEELIHSFSRALRPTDVQSIAAELNFSYSALERSQSSDPQPVSVQAFKLLSDWTASEGGSATVANFVQRMRNARLADDVIKSAVLHSCSQSHN